MASGTGTTHHKIHGLTGWGVIIGLPFALCSAITAIPAGTDGFVSWLSSPVGALGFLAFFTAAIWYTKLEMDEVVMDYFGGGLRKTCLLLLKLIAIIVWLMAAFAAIHFAFLA